MIIERRKLVSHNCTKSNIVALCCFSSLNISIFLSRKLPVYSFRFVWKSILLISRYQIIAIWLSKHLVLSRNQTRYDIRRCNVCIIVQALGAIYKAGGWASRDNIARPDRVISVPQAFHWGRRLQVIIPLSQGQRNNETQQHRTEFQSRHHARSYRVLRMAGQLVSCFYYI